MIGLEQLTVGDWMFLFGVVGTLMWAIQPS